jgi:EmrB/QacA subfamily drug resistance transporter
MTTLAASLDAPAVAGDARRAIAGLSITMLMPSLDTSIANASLPALAGAFGASFQQVQWIVLAYLLAVTTSVVGAGRLGDIVGRRRLLLAAIAVFTIASACCGLAPSLALLLIARGAQGVGAAAMVALAIALVADTVPKAQTGATMGLLGSMSAVGTALGPSLGGTLTATLGWPAIFLVNVPIGVLAFELIRRNVTGGDERSPDQIFDVSGTALLAVAVGAIALAMTRAPGSNPQLGVALIVTALVALAAFYVVESRSANPIVPFAAMRQGGVRAGLAGSLLVSSVMMTTLVIGPFYLTRALGMTTLSAGFVLSIGPLISALSGLPAGRFVDRIGAHRMMIAGLAGISTGAALLALLPSSIGIAGYAGPIALMTSSYATFQAANNTAIMSSIGAGDRGSVAGLLSLSRNLGLSAGAAIMGAIFARAVGSSDLILAAPDAIAGGMRVTFGIAASVIVLAIAIRFPRPSVV